MANVLITGASGFIGTHLVEALVSRGDRVRCLVRESTNRSFLQELPVELQCVDLHSGEQLRRALVGIDVVYHLAGCVWAHDLPVLYRVNRDASHELAAACADQPRPPRLVVASSVAAAGPVARGQVRRETDCPAPMSHYGLSKRGGELAIARFADRVPTIIVRPGIVFGPRNREMLPIFKSIALLGLHLVATFSPPPLSLIHVDDVVDLLIRASERGQCLSSAEPTGGSYFGCADQYPDYAQLGRMIGKALGNPHCAVWHVSMPYLWMLSAGYELLGRVVGQHDSFNVDKIREAVAGSWACSPEAAARELGFRPRYSLQERLEQTVQWYRTAGWLTFRAPPQHVSPRLDATSQTRVA